MNETDDAILEYFGELQSAGFSPWEPPTTVWINLTQNLDAIDKSKDTISRRMQKLDGMGLLERVDDRRGYYRITENGLAYLDGDITVDDIQRPDD